MSFDATKYGTVKTGFDAAKYGYVANQALKGEQHPTRGAGEFDARKYAPVSIPSIGEAYTMGFPEQPAASTRIAPESRLGIGKEPTFASKILTNLPKSAFGTFKAFMEKPITGLQDPDFWKISEQFAKAIKEGRVSKEDLKDIPIVKGMEILNVPKALAWMVTHPKEAFEEDPVGVTMLVTGAVGGAASLLKKAGTSVSRIAQFRKTVNEAVAGSRTIQETRIGQIATEAAISKESALFKGPPQKVGTSTEPPLRSKIISKAKDAQAMEAEAMKEWITNEPRFLKVPKNEGELYRWLRSQEKIRKAQEKPPYSAYPQTPEKAEIRPSHIELHEKIKSPKPPAQAQEIAREVSKDLNFPNMIEMHAGLPLASTEEIIEGGRSAIKTVVDYATRGFVRTKNRLKSVAGKQLYDRVKGYEELRIELGGEFIEKDLVAAGIKDWPKGTTIDQVYQKPGVREFFRKQDALAKKAELQVDIPLHIVESKDGKFYLKANQRIVAQYKSREAAQVALQKKKGKYIRPYSGMGEEYDFPHYLKAEIAQSLWDDTVNVIKKAEKAGKSSDTKWLGDFVGRHGTDSTKKIIKGLMDQGVVENYADALNLVHRYAQNQMFKPMGSFERARIFPEGVIPKEYMEMDARKILVRYALGAADRFSQAQFFGPRGEIAQKLIDALPALETKAGKYSYQFATGTFEALTPGARKAISTFTNFEYLTKIASGTAVIPQATQPLISFMPIGGVQRMIRGALRLMDKDTIKHLREFGIGGASQRAVYERLGVESPGGLMDKLHKLHPGAKAFTYANEGLDYFAASTGEVMVGDWYKLANKGGFRSGMAKRNLERFGVDWQKPLTDQLKKKFQIRSMMETQLHPSVMEEPLWMSDPRFRWLALFKRFGYKQAVLINDHVIGEMKHGNVMPFLRLAAGGYIGGGVVRKAKDLIQEGITGEPVFREHYTFLQDVASRISYCGSVGVLTDIFTRIEQPSKMLSNIVNATSFAVIPVAGQELITGIESIAGGKYDPGLAADIERSELYPKFLREEGKKPTKTAEEVGYAMARRVAKPLGTLPREAVKTVAHSEEEKKQRIKRKRGEMRGRLNTLYRQGKKEVADAMRRRWNKHYPDHKI